MKVYIVVLLVLVAVAAATEVDKRLILPSLHDLVNTLKTQLASHSDLTISVCEAACHRVAGAVSFLCNPACELVVSELSG